MHVHRRHTKSATITSLDILFCFACPDDPAADDTYSEKVKAWLNIRRINKPGVYRVLVGKPEGKNHWGDLGVDGWIIIGWISRR